MIRYHSKSAQLLKAAQLAGAGRRHVTVALHMQARTPKLAKNSVRQYRAALAWYFANQFVGATTSEGSEDALTAFFICLANKVESFDLPPGACAKISKRKSAQKAFPLEPYETVLTHLNGKCRSQRKHRLIAMMMLGLELGLRPIETRSVVCVDAPNNGGYFRITNAKFDEEGERACGEFRYHHYADEHNWPIMKQAVIRSLAILGDDVLPDWEIQHGKKSATPASGCFQTPARS